MASIAFRSRTISAPIPLGAPILWPEMVSRVQESSATETGTFPSACTASVWKMMPASWHRRGDLRHRLNDPDLVVDPHHRDDRGPLRQRPRPARRGRADRRSPPAAAPRARRDGRHACAAASTALCSIAETAAHIGAPRSRAASAAPTMPRLSASVPPEVKTTWLGSAPSASAICRRACSMPGPGRPAKAMGAGGIAEGLVGEVGQHGLQHLGANRGGGGMVEIDGRTHGRKIAAT